MNVALWVQEERYFILLCIIKARMTTKLDLTWLGLEVPPFAKFSMAVMGQHSFLSDPSLTIRPHSRLINTMVLFNAAP